jgi:hypothetical protein
MVALPKALQTTNFGIANAAHCHPKQFALPKALQTTNFVCCLAFLMLTCLQELALDAVRIKKASQLC